MDLHSKRYNINGELKDFSQAQYETYHDELLPLRNASNARTNSGVVRAAIKAGFLVGVEAGAVADMHPAGVVWLAGKVADHVRQVTTSEEDDDAKNS